MPSTHKNLRRATALALGLTLLGGALAAPTVALADDNTNATSTSAAMPWLDTSLDSQQRADLLLAAMNESQLIKMLSGSTTLLGGKVYGGKVGVIGAVNAQPELRIPALAMSDGPAGVRNWLPATMMPSPIAQGASFDPAIAHMQGQTIGIEAKQSGLDLIFAPGFNLARNPINGRTFEYLGEDPLLSGTIAAANVAGMQEAGIMANIKHYVANNQETDRTSSSSNIDERTLHEIYEKPFQIVVEQSNPASAMCAYNRVNGVFACSNADTQIRDLRKNMGFDGFVVSDYPATHATEDLAAGLNIELPMTLHMTEKKVRAAIANGTLTWDDVRLRVREILVKMFDYGLFDHAWNDELGDRVRDLQPMDVAAGDKVAQTIAEQSAVLLKNDGILPLRSKDDASATGVQDRSIKTLLVIGVAAKKAASGGGSSA